MVRECVLSFFSITDTVFSSVIPELVYDLLPEKSITIHDDLMITCSFRAKPMARVWWETEDGKLLPPDVFDTLSNEFEDGLLWVTSYYFWQNHCIGCVFNF